MTTSKAPHTNGIGGHDQFRRDDFDCCHCRDRLLRHPRAKADSMERVNLREDPDRRHHASSRSHHVLFLWSPSGIPWWFPGSLSYPHQVPAKSGKSVNFRGTSAGCTRGPGSLPLQDLKDIPSTGGISLPPISEGVRLPEHRRLLQPASSPAPSTSPQPGAAPPEPAAR